MSIYVNGAEITDDEIYAEMQYHPAENLENAKYQASQALVIRELLLQVAKCLKIYDGKVHDAIELDKVIDQLLEKELKLPEINDDIIERFYIKNKMKFKNATDEFRTLAEVKPTIIEYLNITAWQSAAREYVKHLLQQARIEGFAFN